MLSTPHAGVWAPDPLATLFGAIDAIAYDTMHRQLLAIASTCPGHAHECFDPVYMSANNGHSWQLIARPSSLFLPEDFSAAEMETLVAAPGLGGVVRIIGAACGICPPSPSAFLWNGTSWSTLGSTGYPGFCGAYGYDRPRHVIVNVCGAATYTFDGTAWTLQHPVQSPDGGPLTSQMAYDPASGSLVLVDVDASGVESTWLWDGRDWRLANTGSFTVVPRAACDQYAPTTAGLATDAQDGAVLLTVACDATTQSPASWTWDGASWLRQPLPAGYSGSVAATGTLGPDGFGLLAYDSALKAVLAPSGADLLSSWWEWRALT